jgi:hypothetical protein
MIMRLVRSSLISLVVFGLFAGCDGKKAVTPTDPSKVPQEKQAPKIDTGGKGTSAPL